MLPAHPSFSSLFFLSCRLNAQTAPFFVNGSCAAGREIAQIKARNEGRMRRTDVRRREPRGSATPSCTIYQRPRVRGAVAQVVRAHA